MDLFVFVAAIIQIQMFLKGHSSIVDFNVFHMVIKLLKLLAWEKRFFKITFILKICINPRNPTRFESACCDVGFYYLQEENSPIWLLGSNSCIFTNSILVVTRKNLCQTGCSRRCTTHHCWVNKRVSLNDRHQ